MPVLGAPGRCNYVRRRHGNQYVSFLCFWECYKTYVPFFFDLLLSQPTAQQIEGIFTVYFRSLGGPIWR